MATITKVFNTKSDYTKFIENNPMREDFKGDTTSNFEKSFTNTKSFEESVKLFYEGDPDLAKKITTKLDKVPFTNTKMKVVSKIRCSWLSSISA